MPRGSRKRRNKKGRSRIFIALPLLAVCLALVWIWKANKVKEYYSRMRELEESMKVIQADNSQLRNELSKMKSLMAVKEIATGRLKLTQDVSGRIFLEDPVESPKKDKSFNFVDMDDVTDWLEDVVVRSSKVTAQERSEEKK